MKLPFTISDDTNKIIGFVCANLIEVVLLIYYATFISGQSKIIMLILDNNKLNTYIGLSIAGSVLMMITWLLQIYLIYKFNQKILIAIFVINTISLLILLIGMAFGSETFNVKLYTDKSYNFPVGLWFIQLCLYIMSLVSLHNFKQQAEGNVENVDTNKKKEQIDDSKKQAQNSTTQANQSQVVMMGNNESQFTQQQ